MDIARPSAAKERRRRRIIYGVLGVVVIALVTLGLSRLKPAAPSVDRSTVWIDTVKRGSMLRQVRGLGTLTPTEIRWLPALSDGRVEKILVQVGQPVKADTVLVVLTNPQVEQAATDAEFALKAAEADLASQETQLNSAYLAQKSLAAKANTDYTQAKMKAETDAQLEKLGVISNQNAQISQSTAAQLATADQIEKERVAAAMQQLQASVAAQKAKVEQARALYDLAKKRLDAMSIRAGSDGVLQELSIPINGTPQLLQVGQQVTAGTTIAKVANPKKLKAELKIPETQAKDVELGQPAQVDTHNGVIAGKVIRIDPSVQNGTRTVDVSLEGDLPPGAVPDLSVDGTIDLERLDNVLYVGRPAFGQEKSTVGMFKLEPDGKTAARTQVQLGRSSVNTVEILGGLKEGDQVVLSDMSRWDAFDRIRLE
ncbi:MAG TPA: HlyD family efflux transporter periplasmic adaptor subunit [Terriglobales bacterium]|nr:HlyD family efflux transporter periplasmic adaptor subunit [Terriglobales bacterium]